jgi:hypothetical protein
MNIAALPPTMSVVLPARTPEVLEGPGPDKDGDADDKGVAKQISTSVVPPKGMGVSVDAKA